MVPNLQAQNVDPNYKPSVYSKYEMDGQILASALQPADRKLIISGDFTVVDGSSRKSLARLNADGSLDLSFNPGTSVNDNIYAIALQPDGKVLIGGMFTEYNGKLQNKIARLNKNGSLDTTFNTGQAASNNFSIGTGPDNYINAIELQADGKIIVGGYFTTTTGFYLSKIARLNPDGTIDTSFNPGYGVNNTVNTVAVQPDGRIIIGGSFTAVNKISRVRIARLNTDGSLDASFDVGMEVSSDATTKLDKVVLQPDGKVLIAGDFVSVKGHPQRYFARLNADGSLDAEFNQGSGADGVVNYLLQQPDGKIVLAGEFTTVNNISSQHIARLNSDGTIDASFTPGTGADGKIVTLALFPDGNIAAAGSFTSYSDVECQNIVQVTSTGKLNTQYNIGKGNRSKVKALLVQPDGKVLIGGNFATVTGFSRNFVARLNAGGTLDRSFNTGIGPNDFVNALALQTDGKVLVAGNFIAVNDDSSYSYIARYNADGSFDKTFSPKVDAVIEAVAVQPDGKILIGGNFSKVNDQARSRIARLNADGSLDETFKYATGVNNAITALLVDSEGRIVIGGTFTRVNNIGRKYLARLFSDGRLDIDFYSGVGPDGAVKVLVQQPDGKILFAGLFSNFNGESKKSIARLNTDGSLDASFNTGSGPNNAIYTVFLRSDGRIMVGGTFTEIAGMVRNRVARLKANGSLDPTFDPRVKGNVGTNREVNTLALLPDNRLLLGGYFTMIAGKGRTRIAMLSAKASQTINMPVIESKTEQSGPFPITATASSGLEVKLEVISGPATLEGTTLVITGPGEVKVKATQPGNEDYEAAPAVERTFCVSPTKPQITVNGNVLTSSSDTNNQWYYNGEAIAKATGKTYTVTKAGEYTVVVAVGSCASATSDSQGISEETLEELKPITALTAYPNPATTDLKIKGSNIGTGQITITFYDAAGRKVGQEQVVSSVKDLDITVSVARLPRGYMILQVVTPNGVIRTPFILK
ncbi:T9SS type A sorting domain-containing protein [Adhaeribacter radiodurans]|uniref:T9SS type A sorting domain-containing protein n=1 Tax=Adhaeribacter radiodurans TaxID=2745197 RepID=A0A7L7LD42_9BACT|nr:T9SS type A sorting domain-containing protein [Adhaeribacter radiodurans]QMU30677.1 T9SS type A sorting domain-containing protein [Adhaeribacter radiodurans]